MSLCQKVKKMKDYLQEEDYNFLSTRLLDKKLKNPKKNKDLESLITQTVEKLLKQKQEEDKHINPSPIQSPRQDSISSPNNSDNISDSIHFAQDPNDDDSGMSFDSVALHNLDT